MQTRLLWLDATRGIAVLMVLLAHTTDNFSRRYSDFIQIGNAGVVLFFLCSGYVIPMSLDTLSPAQFWIRRFFRLFPLYWLSIGLFLVLGLNETSTPHEILLNFTTLQTYLGAPHLHPTYWSLTVEMTFYITLSLLQLFGLHQRSLGVFLALIVGLLGLRLISLGAMVMFLYLPMCALGMLFYRLDQRKISRRRVGWATAILLAFILSLPASPAYQSGWVLALSVWITLYRAKEIFRPGWLVWCGMVSYSIYLLHPTVLIPTHGWGWPLVFPIAALGYYLIESRGIKLGRKLTQKVRPPLNVAYAGKVRS